MARNTKKDNSNKTSQKPHSTTDISRDGTQGSGNAQQTDNEPKTVTTDNSKKPIVINSFRPDIKQFENEATRLTTEANAIAGDARDISRRSVYVNAGLLTVTAILALISTCQYINSEKAATIAQKTFNETKKFDSTSLANGKFYSDSSLRVQEKAFRSNDTNYKTSINATNSQFIRLNEPYLEILDATIMLPTVGGNTKFGYNIRNVGNGVVKMIAKTDTIVYIKHPDLCKFKVNPYKFIKIKKFEMNTSEVIGKEKSNVNLSQQDTISGTLYNEIFNKTTSVFYIRKSIYINLINGNYREFDCVMQLYPLWDDKQHTRSSYNTVSNKNYDLKNR
jgi:hypothetical protein